MSGTLNWTQIYEMANVPPPEPTDWTITISSTPLGGGKQLQVVIMTHCN